MQNKSYTWPLREKKLSFNSIMVEHGFLDFKNMRVLLTSRKQIKF